VIALGALTLLLAGIARAVAGFGDALIAIPVLSILLGPRAAIAICSVASLSASAWLLLERRAYARLPKTLIPLIVAAVVGSALGAAVLVRIESRWLALLLAAATLVALMPRRTGPHRTPTSKMASLTVGALYGFVSGATGIGGPLVAAYLGRAIVDTEVYVASLALLFTLSTLLRIGALALTGNYDADSLVLACAASVPLVVGVAAGTRLRRLLDPMLVARLTRVFVLTAVAFLVWTTLANA
jgi:uncharacterized protein